MDYSRPELADRLAAEYVSGALREGARRRLEALLPAHPVLRSAVIRWEHRLLPLTLSIPPVTPAPAVWQSVVARLGFATPAPLVRWWQGLTFWRGLSALATVCALGLGLNLLKPAGEVAPPIVVVLEPATSTDNSNGLVRASFVAGISGDGRAIVTRPLTPVSLRADRALELWAVPAQGAPRSLGLIAADAPTVVQRGLVPAGTQALAVSLEPVGGSTTGAPTGPVLYVGKLRS